MRNMLVKHKELFLKIELMKKRLTGQDNQIKLLFDYLKQFIREQSAPREKLGLSCQTRRLSKF